MTRFIIFNKKGTLKIYLHKENKNEPFKLEV